MSAKPSIPKGTRDFLPQQVIKRKYIFNTIESVFKTYGYLPIETPTMENLSTLTGKYGEEGDRLLFKVLNNGDFLADVKAENLVNKESNKVISQISKRGLRYDLTVPFARFVVMNQNEISLPFKRYQIQQVWRADRPQRGRYQEFYQCDVDVVGSDSLMYEAELVQIYAEVFRKLGIKTKILINNRKILFGLAEAAGITDKFMEMTIAIDKLDKIGKDGVIKEMSDRHITSLQAEKVLQLLSISDLASLKQAFLGLDEGTKGIEEIQTVLDFLDGSIPELTFDISLARGLNYYTGCIFEVKVDTSASGHPGFVMGSIGGGGRYDNLTGVFGLNGVSGVGVSFGAERIYDVMEELNLFPSDVQKDIEVLFVALDEESHKYAFKQVSSLREAGIACDLYPEPAKMKKQMSYANARNVPYVAIIGETERLEGKVSLKNMITGEQKDVILEDLAYHFTNNK
ncbi:MAG: histidine--tRNA ligase [Saprospiraceae bacterium]|nr:histidine--tRNA ligase [Saprospiraceae bacterium]